MANDYMRGLRWFDRKNFEAARRSWEPLASASDCDAEAGMGTLYFFGAGVPQDYKIAHRWWLTAANRGQAFAQTFLATVYAHDRMSIRAAVGGGVTTYDCRQGCGYEKT